MFLHFIQTLCCSHDYSREAFSFAKLHNFKSISKFYSQLLRYLSPVRNWHGPFFTDIAMSQIHKFLQRCICRGNAFRPGDFSDLSMIALNRVGRIDEFADGRVYWKYSVRCSQLSRHDLITIGYISPHLPSNRSKFAVAESLLTAPCTVRKSLMKSF